EAASLGAAAHDLEPETVLHDLDRRDHRLLGIEIGRELLDPDALGFLRRLGGVARVRDDPVAVVADVVERGDVDAGARGEGEEPLATGKSLRLANLLEEGGERLLAVAEEEAVEEIRRRLGVG